MLSQRILGVLKQYPNPEVAFYVLELIQRGRSSLYFNVGGANPPRKFWGNETPDEMRARLYDLFWVHTGRETLRNDFASWLAPEESLPIELSETDFLKELKNYVKQVVVGQGPASRIYRLTVPLQENTIYDQLVPWLAKVVNAWLKSEPQREPFVLPTLTTRGYEFPPNYVTLQRASIQLIKDHYKKMKDFARELPSILDWVDVTHPELMPLSPTQVMHRSRRWHNSLRKQKQVAVASQDPVVFEYGKFKVHELLQHESIQNEGRCMGNCLNSRGTYYALQVALKKSRIFSLRQNGVSKVSFETVPYHVRGSITGREYDSIVRQLEAKAGTPVVRRDQQEALMAFFKQFDVYCEECVVEWGMKLDSVTARQHLWEK